jgi:hypothetical protein
MTPLVSLRKTTFVSALLLAVTIAGCDDTSSDTSITSPAGTGSGGASAGSGAGTGGAAGTAGTGGAGGAAAGCAGMGGKAQGGAGMAGAGMAGATGMGGASGATEIARLTAPTGEGFGEAVIAAAGNELLVAYTRVNQARDVHVEAQRFSREKASIGAPIGSPISLHTYNLYTGQMAPLENGFHGNLSMATDGNRYVLCWGELSQRECAAIPVGAGEAVVASIVPASGDYVYVSRVVHGAAGWFAFTRSNLTTGNKPVALELGEDASLSQVHQLQTPAVLGGVLATATASGFAVVSTYTSNSWLTRLGPDLKPTGNSLDLGLVATGIAASGDVVSAVGETAVVRVDESDHLTTSPLGGQSLKRNVFAFKDGTFGVTWTESDKTLLAPIDAANQVGAIEQVGQSPSGIHFLTPRVAVSEDGVFFASPHPDGEFEIFYNQVFPTLRVTRLVQP